MVVVPNENIVFVNNDEIKMETMMTILVVTIGIIITILIWIMIMTFHDKNDAEVARIVMVQTVRLYFIMHCF